MAKGDYILLQDADDVSRRDRIEIQLAHALQNPGKRVVGCWINRIEGEESRILKTPEIHAEIIKGFERFFNRSILLLVRFWLPDKSSHTYHIESCLSGCMIGTLCCE